MRETSCGCFGSAGLSCRSMRRGGDSHGTSLPRWPSRCGSFCSVQTMVLRVTGEPKVTLLHRNRQNNHENRPPHHNPIPNTCPHSHKVFKLSFPNCNMPQDIYSPHCCNQAMIYVGQLYTMRMTAPTPRCTARIYLCSACNREYAFAREEAPHLLSIEPDDNPDK